MTTLEIIFWSIFFLIFYTYLGYGIFLYAAVLIKRIFVKSTSPFDDSFEPEITLFIPCYNEKDILQMKIDNTFALDYPKEKLKIMFVTDGSNDGSELFLSKIEGVEVLHEDGRAGKIGAMNRGMKHVSSSIVIFSDANTILNKLAIKNIVRHFANENVGCVAGEKRIETKDVDTASGSGEGIYWKYESFLKRLDSELNSVVGAAGELFALKTNLFEDLEKDTLLDDFMLSLRIAAKKYKVVYEKEAYAKESASANIKEELKRKIRIAAGGIQSIIRLKMLLNPFRYGVLTWQYVSHRVLRWTITPLLLLSLLNINIALVVLRESHWAYSVILFLQITTYSLATYGFFLKDVKTKSKIIFVPFYFMMMNYAVVQGIKRYFKGSQSVLWEKAKRA